MMHSNFLSYQFILAVSLSTVAATVRIQSISVPDKLNGSSSEPLKIDCTLEIDDGSKLEPKHLVMKWMLNNALIYQWSNRKEFFNATFGNKILGERRNLTEMGKLIHMPLTITNRTTNLTGLYECQIEYEANAESKQKYMQVYIPAKTLGLKKDVNKETNTLNITCSAKGLYPKPTISLIADRERLQNFTRVNLDPTNKLYDVSATFTVDLERLKPHTIFNCSITLPQVNLTYYEQLAYLKSGPDGVGNSPSSEEKDQNNGTNLSYARYNVNLMLTLSLAVWLFAPAVNRLSVDLIKS